MNNITILTDSLATPKLRLFIYEGMYSSKSEDSMHKLSGLSEGHKETEC